MATKAKSSSNAANVSDAIDVFLNGINGIMPKELLNILARMHPATVHPVMDSFVPFEVHSICVIVLVV